MALDDLSVRLPPTATNVPWRRVALGLFLKLAGQATGIITVLSAAGLWAVEGTGPLRQSWPVLAVLLGVAVLLDVSGRLLCLAAPPQLYARGRVVGSVLAQVASLLLLAASLPWPFYGPEQEFLAARAVLFLSGPLLQFVAAHLFTGFLHAVAEHFEKPRLAVLASSLATSLWVLAVALTVTVAVVLVLGVMVFVLGVLACWFVAFVWFLGGVVGVVLSLPFVAVTLAVAGAVQGLYAVLVFSLAVHIWRLTQPSEA